MKRREDWPHRLAVAIEAARKRPFDWATNTCGHLVADIVLAMTGEDLAAEFRERCGDRRTTLQLLARHGGVEGMARRALGEPLPNPRLAQRGDVAAIDTKDGPVFGVCTGRDFASVGPEGMAFVPITDPAIRAAWRV